MKTAADVTQGKNSIQPRLGKAIHYLAAEREAESTSCLQSTHGEGDSFLCLQNRIHCRQLMLKRSLN